MVYAAAQIQSTKENVECNIEKHMEFIRQAAKYKSSILVFPELSITGYERELAEKQSFDYDDIRLECFKNAATDYQMLIVAGAPLALDEKLYIASWIFIPEKAPEIYIKKFLHPGEEVFFQTTTNHDPLIDLLDQKMSFAICYDIERDEHVESAKKRETNLYIASIFYTQGGIQSGLQRLQSISQQNSFHVLMSNYVGEGWGLQAGGCSSMWSNRGELIVSANSYSECLVTAENKDTGWSGKIIEM